MNKEDTIEGPPRDPLIESIRERVNAYIKGDPGFEGMSLRELSRRIGMSASGLMKFADGSMPYTPTRRKLTRWFKTLAAASRDEQKRDGLSMLLVDVHPSRRAEAERQVLQVVAEYESLSPDAARPGRPRGAARGKPRAG